MRSSESIAAISKALVAAWAVLENPKNTATNPHFQSKYAPLDVILNGARHVFANCKISIMQSAQTRDGWPAVVTRLLHESGEWIESEPFATPPQKDTAQGHCSGITYARRYSLAAILGISSEDDDDGHRASAGGSGGRSHASPQDVPAGGSSGPPTDAPTGTAPGGRPAGYRFDLSEQPAYMSGAHVFAKGPKREAWDGWTWGEMATSHAELLAMGGATPEQSPIANMLASDFIKGWNAEQASAIDTDAKRKVASGWKPTSMTQNAEPPPDMGPDDDIDTSDLPF